MNMSNPTDYFNICMACDDNYAPHAAALIASIYTNKNEEDRLRFFILSDGLSEQVKQRFYSMAEQWKLPISLVDCPDDMFQGLRTWRGKYNAYFRLAIHRMIPADISKALYLDCDVVVMTSLAPLFNVDLSDKYAAVVAMTKDPGFSSFVTHHSPYFSSGMILFNLEKYRADDIERKAVEIGMRRFSEISFPDQDLLNEAFAGNVAFVPLKWHIVQFPIHHRYNKLSGPPLVYSIDELKAALSDPGVIHFNSHPWRALCPHPLRHVYWKYLRMTPFYQEIVTRYWISWLTEPYRRYFRMNVSKRNIHIRLFGVDIIKSNLLGQKRTHE
jgi:lipopolysaccharide biosynthesis glycosyltransferase